LRWGPAGERALTSGRLRRTDLPGRPWPRPRNSEAGQIDLVQVWELLDGGAQLVEVLPGAGYAEEHLPGAVNLLLKELDATTTSRLDRTSR
jgi:hypothetical protein